MVAKTRRGEGGKSAGQWSLLLSGAILGAALSFVFNVFLQDYLSDLQNYITMSSELSGPLNESIVLHLTECSDGAAINTGLFPTIPGAVNSKYTLKYWMSDGTAQLTDKTTESVLLERSPVEGLSATELSLGASVRIGDKCFTVVSYADEASRTLARAHRQSTLAIIKPDAMPRAGDVISSVYDHGLVIGDLRLVQLSTQHSKHFYQEHKHRPFFDPLVSYMSRSPVIAMRLEGADAVRRWRQALGPTDSRRAREEAPTSIRAIYGTDKEENAAHGSDSEASALREVSLFFPHSMIESNRVPSLVPVFSLNSTCCIVLPHIINTKSLGRLLSSLRSDHYCAPAEMEMTRLSYTEAVRYSTGSLQPQISQHNQASVEALMVGPVVFLTLESTSNESQEEFNLRFKNIIGPANPARARKTAVESIRAAFGRNEVENALLCPAYDFS